MIILELLTVGAALGGGYAWTKGFVQRRLRYVDAVHTRPVPWIAGAVVAVAAAPFTYLPLIAFAVPHVAALALGAGVGLGVKSAQRDRLLPPGD